MLATINPARFMRLDGERGSLTPGKRADLVVLDHAFAVQMTIVEGRVVYDGRAGHASSGRREGDRVL